MNAKLGSNPSYAWRSIFKALEVIRSGTRWRVGNGKLIHIWEDKWLPTPTTYKVISPPQPLDDFPMVFALINGETRRWKMDMVKSLFLPFEEETILNIPLSYNLPKDKIIWVGNKKGEFTIKSTYYIALNVLSSSRGGGSGECSHGDPRTPLRKKIWHLKIPPKIRIFMWKACENALPTMLNLRKRGVATDGVCPICGNEAKSICHALFRCNFAKDVWSRWNECTIKICAENQDFVDVALGLFYAGTNKDMEIMAVTAWAIWYNRNQCVHEGEKLAAGQVWDFALNLLLNYNEASKFFKLGLDYCEIS